MRRELVLLGALALPACAPPRGAAPPRAAPPRATVIGADRRRPSSPRAIVAGRMAAAPRERWRIDTGIQAAMLAIRPSGGGPAPVSPPVSGAGRRGHVLPDTPGEQEINWSSNWTEGAATLRC